MTTPGVTLYGFAYGECLEGIPPRSSGYRLLAPTEPEAWSAEIETLAHQLQATGYPDQWPPTELFCSVILTDRRRLVALARYGLVDHTISHRRGGLELVGVVASGDLTGPVMIAVYRWLRQCRAESEDLRSFAGVYALGEILQRFPPQAESNRTSGSRQDSPLLFAAMAPSDPDDRLEQLTKTAAGSWQWLPLVGPNFPLRAYADQGPVFAWTPIHAAKGFLHHPNARLVPGDRLSKRARVLLTASALVLLILLVANIWIVSAMSKRASDTSSSQPAARRSDDSSIQASINHGRDPREQFAEAIYELLRKPRTTEGWTQGQLIERYQHLAARDERLKVASREGKAAVAGLSLLSQRSTSHIEGLIRNALNNKGYDPELVNLACRRVREKLAAQLGNPGAPDS
jgi:hypothetical protein